MVDQAKSIAYHIWFHCWSVNQIVCCSLVLLGNILYSTPGMGPGWEIPIVWIVIPFKRNNKSRWRTQGFSPCRVRGFGVIWEQRKNRFLDPQDYQIMICDPETEGLERYLGKKEHPTLTTGIVVLKPTWKRELKRARSSLQVPMRWCGVELDTVVRTSCILFGLLRHFWAVVTSVWTSGAGNDFKLVMG